MDRDRRPVAPCVTSATIAGQMAPEGCFNPAWKRKSGGRRQIRARASADRFRLAFPPPVASLPDASAVALRFGSIGLSESSLGACERSGATLIQSRFPKAARAKGGDHVALIASGMTVHEHLAVSPAIERLGLRSSCAGQRAIHVAPALRPPSALAMVSAAMATSLGTGF